MRKRYFKLNFEKVRNNSIPHTPRSAIEIVHLSSTYDGQGIGQVSPNCVNVKEILYYADRMITELKQIKVEAQSQYKKYYTK